MECPQYSIQLEAPGYLGASCLLPTFDAASVTWLNSRSSLAPCDWLLSTLSAVLWTHVRRHRKFGGVSCTECTGQGNDFELISSVKMETRHPVEGSFGNECPSTYNHCRVMEAWSRKTLKNFNFCVFFGETTPYGKIFKILFQNDLSQHESTCCIQILWNFADGKSVKSWVAYLTKNKISHGSSARATARITPKICQGQPHAHNVFRVLQISSKLVHFRRSYIRTREHCQSALKSESNIQLKPNFEPNNKCRVVLQRIHTFLNGHLPLIVVAASVTELVMCLAHCCSQASKLSNALSDTLQPDGTSEHCRVSLLK